MLSVTQITWILAVFGSLTHGSHSCDNLRRITKDTCLRISDHINKRNTNFLDYGYGIKFKREENDDDSYVELTHRKFRRGFLKVHNPHAEEIFAHYKNQVQDYDESIQNSILTEGMSVKHKYPIRNKRNAGAKISFCCQRTRSPPCEIYFCHDD